MFLAPLFRAPKTIGSGSAAPSSYWDAGTTYTAATAEYSDVNNTMAFCDDGDTLSIPAGTSTWSSTLNVTKGIRVKGNGKASTIITADGPTRRLIVLSPGSEKAQRVTEIGFIGGRHIKAEGSSTGAFKMSQMRIDNCGMTGGEDSIWVTGRCEGLIDHNVLLNNLRTILVSGDGDYSWDRDIVAGTEHSLFIECNNFSKDGTVNLLDYEIYHYGGARTTVRYNDFDGNAYTSWEYYVLDSHGNYPYVTAYPNVRGQPLIEFYRNTIRVYKAWTPVDFRGGSVILHHNNYTVGAGGMTQYLQLWDEESQYSWWTGGIRTVWPAQDQIANSFFWENYVDGVLQNDVFWNTDADKVFIQKDRDYFMHAPAASGGKTSYTGSKKGGSSASAPTDGSFDFNDGYQHYYTDVGDTVFSASGPNAYYPYIEYAYPHPLQNG